MRRKLDPCAADGGADTSGDAGVCGASYCSRAAACCHRDDLAWVDVRQKACAPRLLGVQRGRCLDFSDRVGEVVGAVHHRDAATVGGGHTLPAKAVAQPDARPWNIFTFENDRCFLHGSTRSTNNWDNLHLAAFAFGNTTTFAILADKALTTVLAGRVRQGTAPALSALAVAIIAVTVLGAIVYKAIKRREDTRREAVLRAAEALDAQEIVAA